MTLKHLKPIKKMQSETVIKFKIETTNLHTTENIKVITRQKSSRDWETKEREDQ